jgi:tetratricopeptide (TPR) repeat protein
MKYLWISVLVLAVSCASKKDASDTDVSSVTNDSFKKETALKNSELQDYYSSHPKSMSPALEDETLDRYSAEELAQLADVKDPLLEMSIRCSKGDFKTAFQVASKNFNRYQKTAAYWNQVGNCHLNEGAQRKALLFYNKALEVSPNYAPALNNIGVMYSRQGQDQKALIAFERAMKASKFAKTPRYNVAKLYLTYGIAESALPIFKGLLSNANSDVDLLNAVATCHFLQGDYQNAYLFFERIPQGEWSRAEIGLNAAYTLKKMNRAADAQKVFESVETPKSGPLRNYYASVGKLIGEK